jgi:nucleotide-binding universal stress UspA family protein
MIQGDPRSTLVEEARRTGADLLVVGSHGRSGLSKLVLGSVAAYVASHAPCSVLIVKRPHDTA